MLHGLTGLYQIIFLISSAEFNNKLAQVGLGNSGTPVSAPPPPPPPPPQDVAAAASSTPSSTGGIKTSSIYNLIKKREEGAMQATDNRKVADAV